MLKKMCVEISDFLSEGSLRNVNTQKWKSQSKNKVVRRGRMTEG
jgi:hypothetical protein